MSEGKRGQVLLVRMPGDHARADGTIPPHPRDHLWPLRLMYGAAALRNAGFEAHILDLSLPGMTVDAVLRYLAEHDAATVVLDINTPDLRRAPALAGRIRASHPTTSVWAVGQHPSYSVAPFLEDDTFDGCVRGEILSSVVPIAEQRPAAEIPGAVVSNGDGESCTQAAAAPPPDEIPYPSPTGLPHDAYGLLSIHVPALTRQRWGFLLTSWGCPNQCLFCSQTLRHTFGNRWRGQSPERVVGDMERLSKDHGVEAVYLADDLTTFDRDRILGIADLLERKRLGLRWVMQTCSRFLDTEMLPLLRRSGCVGIKFGVESGEEEVRRRIGKPLDPDHVVAIADALHHAGITLTTYYMVGLPGETLAQMETTYRLARRIGSEMIQVALYTPYPTSQGFEELPPQLQEELLREPERFSHYDARRPINVSAVSDEQLLRFHRDFYLRYFLSVPQIWRYLSRRAIYTVPQGLDTNLMRLSLSYLRHRSAAGRSK